MTPEELRDWINTLTLEQAREVSHLLFVQFMLASSPNKEAKTLYFGPVPDRTPLIEKLEAAGYKNWTLEQSQEINNLVHKRRADLDPELREAQRLNKADLFTDPSFASLAQTVLLPARALADAQGHVSLGTDHLLLALCQSTGIAHDLLAEQNVTLPRVQELLQQITGPGLRPADTPIKLPFKTRSFLLSARRNATSKSATPGPEHVLQEFIKESHSLPCLATTLLHLLDFDYPRARERLTAIIGPEPALIEPEPFPKKTQGSSVFINHQL